MGGDRNQFALRLFSGIADRYERPAAILSFGQYGRWRRAAVRALAPATGAVTLDVATGTGLVARDLRRMSARVVGLDQSVDMLAGSRRRALTVVAGRAEQLPFPDATFDALTFSYLLRYVEDPAATLMELVRVLKPGARMASIEFGVPRWAVARAVWRAYTRVALPRAGGLVSPEWRAAGAFLGPSIEKLEMHLPPEEQTRLWEKAGMTGVRTKRLTLGAGVVMWGHKDG